MGELLAQVGDLVFSIFVGYLGALEFLYVVRHLYHWTFRHGEGGANNDAKSLRRLQDGVRNQLDAAAAREAATGTQVMQDGVPYKDGFRINPNQEELDELKAKLSCSSDDKEARRKEIEAELARQKRIEEETKQQLQKAEDDLQRQRQLIAAAEGEEQAKQLLEAERNREEQQRRVEIEKQEKEENERKLLEAEKEEEEQQKRREEEERAEEERSVAAEQKRLEEARNARLAQLELERQREEQQREMELRKKEREKAISEEAERQRALEDARLQAEREAERLLKAERDFELLQEQIEEQVAAEQVRLLLEAEREQERRQRDNEENTERLLENERREEEEQRRNDITRAANENEEIKDKHEEEEEIAELDNAKRFIDFMSGQQNLEEEQDSAEIILSSERDNELKHKETEDGEGNRSTTADCEKERLRKIKEENARKFLEAEEEMVELQRQMEAGVQKRQVSLTQQESVVEEPCIRKEFRPLYEPDRVPQSIKTQFKQARNEVSLSPKTLRFPSLPDDTSSLEPGSLSTQSSLSAQISEDMSANEPVVVGVLEREAPDGEDNVPAIHYTDEYLRSLDGIKQRPLTREDGSGRRRAFKKRRSSGSSNSSRDSRASREEEVKMFTSLEEEEMAEGKKGGGDDDFTTIKYSSEPTLKVKGHRRRHKRSPAQDAKASDDSLRNSLEMLNEESTNPWGEVVPEHYKNTDFWKREKGISIDEEEGEAAKPETKAQAVAMEAATNIPNASSFEDATQTQHEDALLSLQKQTSKGTEKEVNRDAPPNDRNANLQSTSSHAERTSSPARSSNSPRLRRSPRIDELDQYEDHEKEPDITQKAAPSTPSIIVEAAAERESWRDQYGLLVEGISDFYDFTASINPSRSRSTSRNPSRATTPTNQPNLAFPKNVSYKVRNQEQRDVKEYTRGDPNDIEVYNDTGNPVGQEIHRDGLRDIMDGISSDKPPLDTYNNSGSEISNDNSYKETSGKEIHQRNIPKILVDRGNDESVEEDEMNTLVASLRTQRCISRSQSRSRSRSPLPTPDNIERSIQTRRSKRIQYNDELFEKLEPSQSPPQNVSNIQLKAPSVFVESIDENNNSDGDNDNFSSEDMNNLVASLRTARANSRSRSKSPMRVPTEENLRRSVETRRSKLIQQNDELLAELERNSRTPERNVADEEAYRTQRSNSPSRSPIPIIKDYLIDEQQILSDEKALEKIRSANEEVELNVQPREDQVAGESPNESENCENLDRPFDKDRLRQLKCSPTTPDYDRSISTEWKDVQRIKEEIMASGFKRSTYVGESMDLGREYVDLRRQMEQFRRSRSRSRSPCLDDVLIMEQARSNAAKNRQIQEQILSEITTDIKEETDYEKKFGAKPKADRKKASIDLDVGESLDMSAQFEEMRRENAEFRRSGSRSRSPLSEQETLMLAEIESEAKRKDIQDRILDEIERTTINFQDFSRHLNVDFLDNDRRASDSALIQKPEAIIQLQECEDYLDMEPEEYHHDRRYSLQQEQPVEEYPNDDYVYVQQIEVRTLTGTRTWTREDYYSQDLEVPNIELLSPQSSREGSAEASGEEAEKLHEEDDTTEGSEDERRTVVEVEDEIDEDICDFSERGTADESHHEQSECEEAEREVDQYADRRAADWMEGPENADGDNSYLRDVQNEEGAAGGKDSDSFEIDEIYLDAVRNRKQSGIMRDYDSILQDMQRSQEELSDTQASGQQRDGGSLTNEGDRYAIWAKTRNMERKNRGGVRGTGSLLRNFIENERRDTERRYLGDATVTARNATRLRSRYGYMPVLQIKAVEDIDVDLNYKPKREYNWRKNFKLDDEGKPNESESKPGVREYPMDLDEDMQAQYVDIRKFSEGGESITLFSRSPDRDVLANVLAEEAANSCTENNNGMDTENSKQTKDFMDTPEKPKTPKKSKRKLRKESKESIEKIAPDEDESEFQGFSRRSSTIQRETESPKRKSRSRRGSRSGGLVNEDSTELNSPRGSLSYAEAMEGTSEESSGKKKKRTKKRKTKETTIHEPLIREEQHNVSGNSGEYLREKMPTISAAVTPNSAAANVLSSLSPANSVCVIAASTESEANESHNSDAAASVAASSSITDSFDILKDGNLYPLF